MHDGVTYQIYAGSADGAVKVAVDSEVTVSMG